MVAALPARVGPGKPQPVCKVPLGGYCPPVDIYAVSFSLGGALSLGLTADPGPGAWVAAEIRPIERFSMGFELRGTFPSRVVAVEPADPTKPFGTPKEPDVSSLAVLFVPCFRYWRLMGCAVGHFGFDMGQSPTDLAGWPVLGAGPRIGIEIPFAERFFVRGHGDAIFQFTGSGFTLEDENLAWSQSLVSGYIGIGLGVTLR